MPTTKFLTKSRSRVAAGVLAGALMLAVAPAFAGGCPADQMGVDTIQDPRMAASGVTDTVVGMIDLSKEKVAIDRRFRLRRLEVAPGGVVPWHSHADRPALISVVSGAITEYSSSCKAPIEHKAGEVSVEQGGLSHWWKNNGSETAVLYSADLFSDPNDHSM